MARLALKLLLPWYKYPPFSETSTGGLSVSIWELTRSLTDQGVSIEVLCPSETRTEIVSKEEGIVVTRNRLGKKIVENRKLEKHDRDSISTFDSVLSINNFGARSLSVIKRKVVRQIHTVAHDRPVSTYVSLAPPLTEYLRMFVQKRREMSSESSLSGIGSVCVSNYNLDKMAYYDLESKENLVHIPNGVPTSIFRPTKKDSKFDLIFIGRFQKLKGLDILLQAISILSRQNFKPSLAILGPFSLPQQTFCLNLVPAQIRNNIKFLGVVNHENVPQLINASKILVVPSRYESFSLPALESIACGTAVVASSVGGISELVNDSSGILLKKLDAENLAKSIATALKSNQLRDEAEVSGPLLAVKYDSRYIAKRLMEYLVTRMND